MKVCGAIGPWRKPASLDDARGMTDMIIDNLDQEWLLRIGLELLGVPEATDYVVNDWKSHRRKPLRTYRPYSSTCCRDATESHAERCPQ